MIQQATNLPSERFVDVYVCDDTCCQIFIVWIYISLLLWCLLLLVLLVQIQGVQVYMVDIYGSVSMLFAISHSNSNNDNNTNLKWSQCPMLMSDGDTHTLSLYTIRLCIIQTSSLGHHPHLHRDDERSYWEIFFSLSLSLLWDTYEQ